MQKSSKIFVAGHKGLVGSALVRRLRSLGFENLVLADREALDLSNQGQVYNFFESQKPEYVFVSAAKVGGIEANRTFPADFIFSNLQIQNNLIHASYINKVKKLLFLGSSCIYPKFANQPIKEDELLSGKLEPTNEPYAIAKIAGIIMCQSYNRQFGTNFISVMPTNLYGPNDNYHPSNSHVLPALIRKFHEAKTNNFPNVVVWGTGKSKREFMYSDDMADACILMMQKHDGNEIVNIGVGNDISIGEVANLVKEIVGYSGKLVFDTSMPDGTPRKLLDVDRLSSYGFSPKVDLNSGIKLAYEDFLKKIQQEQL